MGLVFLFESGNLNAMAEKTLNDLPRDLRIIFTRGSDALSRDNYDYAILCFNQVLAKEPGLYECRMALRAAQVRKAGKGGGFFKKVFSSASSSPLVAKGQFALREDPVKALEIAEQILNNDPSNSAAHRIIVDAARALQLPQTLTLSLEILHRNLPKNTEIAIQLAHALADVGEVTRGEKILIDLCQANPADNDLAQALKNVSARKTLDEGGYEALSDGTGSYRDILRDEKEAIALEQQNRSVVTEDATDRLIREYEARLKTEPGNLKLVRSLAELYAQQKNFEKSLAFYEQLKTSDQGRDPNLERAVASTVVRQFEHRIAQLDPNAPDYAEVVAQLQLEKQTFQLGECRKRVDRFPTDLALRFEMGVLNFEAGRISEAIQDFQKAQNNPHRRVASMKYLARCFAQRKMYDLASRALQNALKEKQVFDDEKKELLYLLGCVQESMGRKAEAIEQFKLIYEVDSAYKDVGAKVDAFYSDLG